MNYEEVEVVPNAWSAELSSDLLGLIADKLRSLSLSEYIKFGCVCLEWRSFSIQNYQHIKLPKQAPLLLIPLPPSLDHHHQKKIPSLPSSSSSSSSSSEEKKEGEEDHKGAEVEEKETEAAYVVAEAEAKTETVEDAVDVAEAVDDAADDDAAEADDDDDDDDEVVVRVRVRNRIANYYNPKEIWQGQDHKQRHRSVRILYSLSEKMVYHDFPLPVPYYKNIRGSSHGWLVTVEECWGEDSSGNPYLPVSLFNPFRTDNNEIQLPPMTSGNPGNLDFGERINHSFFLKKAFLSSNPSSLSDPTTQLVVLAVYGHNRLALCRPGDKSWTRLDLEEYRPIQDLICYQDQFYAVLQSGYVFAFVIDAAKLVPIVTLGFLPPKEDDYPNIGILTRRYLIESGGDLLQVWRNVDYPIPIGVGGYITREFLIFKLDSKTEEWVHMKTLNNHMIFIGDNNSISISASEFPRWSKPNSIYYTDDNYTSFCCKPQNGPHDIGVFNLEDGSFQRHYEAESKTIMPPPIWIQPML